MPRANANGVDLYYEEHGTGIPILCIHGTSSSALVWGDAAQELGERGRCIVYDRRGCYRSQRPQPYETTDVADHTEDAAELLEELGATPAVVIGRSYGGEIALDLARRWPNHVKALALLEPAMLTLDPEGKDWLDALRRRALQAGANDVSSVARVFLQDVVGAEVWESFSEELKDMFAGNGPAILAELRGRSLELSGHELAEVDQPTLMVSAKDSPETFRRVDDIVAKALPNCAKVLVDGSHLINPAHPAILDFVDHQVALHTPAT
jgi:pimeloyl-ACP methyl ester carboxylesterase